MIKASGWIQFLLLAFLLVTDKSVSGQNLNNKPVFHVLVLAERGGLHEGFVVAALDWLSHFSQEKDFDFTVINQADSLTSDYLSHYRVFIQLNFPPYRWSAESKEAFTGRV